MANIDKPLSPAEKLDEKKDQLPPENDRFLAFNNFKPLTFDVVPGKSSWPELVGTKGEEAVVIIKKENPLVNPVIVKATVAIPLSPYIFDRVRVFVDEAVIVVTVPTIG